MSSTMKQYLHIYLLYAQVHAKKIRVTENGQDATEEFEARYSNLRGYIFEDFENLEYEEDYQEIDILEGEIIVSYMYINCSYSIDYMISNVRIVVDGTQCTAKIVNKRYLKLAGAEFLASDKTRVWAVLNTEVEMRHLIGWLQDKEMVEDECMYPLYSCTCDDVHSVNFMGSVLTNKAKIEYDLTEISVNASPNDASDTGQNEPDNADTQLIRFFYDSKKCGVISKLNRQVLLDCRAAQNSKDIFAVAIPTGCITHKFSVKYLGGMSPEALLQINIDEKIHIMLDGEVVGDGEWLLPLEDSLPTETRSAIYVNITPKIFYIAHSLLDGEIVL